MLTVRMVNFEMTKGRYKRKARKVGPRRGGGSKMNDCCKRAQRATMRLLDPDETWTEHMARMRARMQAPTQGG